MRFIAIAIAIGIELPSGAVIDVDSDWDGLEYGIAILAG